jgi:hypothetical protein
MKVLTLTQPWASLVAIGAKRIETRSWSTSYRGPLAIHAAKGFPREAREFAECRMVTELMCKHLGREQIWISDYPVGTIVATCRLARCYPTDRVAIGSILGDGEGLQLPVTEQEYALGNYDPERWAWLLADIKALLEPIPAKGSLGLWEWDERA